MAVVASIGLLAGTARAQPLPAPQPPSTPTPNLPTPQAPAPHAGSGSGSGSGPTVLQLGPDAAIPEVRATASPTVVKLGAPFTLFVTAAFGDGVEVNLRDHFELGGAFEIRRKDSEDRTRADGKHVREWQIELVAWEIGELQVPPIPVTFTFGGKAAQLDTNPTPVRVIGMLGDVDDAKQLRDASPPTRLWSRDWLLLWISVGALLLLAALITYLGWRASRRKRTIRLTGGMMIPRLKIDTPGERALARLLAIEQSGVLDADDDRKRGYQEMVEVIREYLGARYRVATYDLTTYELMRKLEPVAPADERVMVEAWLERCDIVKYGGLRASQGDAHAVLGDARALVVATQPAIAAPASSPPEPPPPEEVAA